MNSSPAPAKEIAPDSSFHLLILGFSVLAPIRRLNHFHGPQWSAMFRFLLRASTGKTVEHAVQPIETGILNYEIGETINLGLYVPAASADYIHQVLEQFNECSGTSRGHFQPGVTIRLDKVTSRLSGNTWHPHDPPLSPSDIEAEIEGLCDLESFSIETLSPLRIGRPPGQKVKNHRFCDADFFLSGDREAAISFFIDKLGSQKNNGTAASLTISDGTLSWLDSKWGQGKKAKTIGGVVGRLDITGTPSREQAERLVLGQYTGIGKNRNFGLGFYQIPQLASVRDIIPLTRSTTLLQRAMDKKALAAALARLPDSSPGSDGMTLADAKAAGTDLLQTLKEKVLAGPETVHVDLLRHQLPKPSGGHRVIHIQNMGERIIHRSFADAFTPSLKELLSASAYAYRRGLSRNNAARTLNKLLADGYDRGIKADIASFFDSVNIGDLCNLLAGFFPGEPLVQHLCSWLQTVNRQGVTGLPQGWSLAPPLSNLYLERFDRKMETEGFRLVRYADDFVVLCRSDTGVETCTQAVEKSLSRLGLALNPDKTLPVAAKEPVPFLGYLVSSEELQQEQKSKKLPEEAWDTLFGPEWRQGTPVYLTSICRGAYSSGPKLVVKKENEQTESIPWNRISRIVIVGRSSFSGGVIYRAVRERIPVTFIDVMGRATGRLYAPDTGGASLAVTQKKKQADPAWVLDFSRLQIAAKIRNSTVLLRRNGISDPFLVEIESSAAAADSLDSLRGIEGAAARVYFNHFATLVAPFEFHGRVYHPPDGPVNVMLSFGYTLLYNRLAATLRDRGFNPRLGFFHAGRGRHAALASDLMEPLRHIVERIVLSLIHLREVTPAEFTTQKRGGKDICRLDGKGFRTFINRYEWTMASCFTPPKGSRVSYNQWLEEAADDLRRSISFNLPCRPLRIS